MQDVLEAAKMNLGEVVAEVSRSIEMVRWVRSQSSIL
jgi:hypothetical protein